MKKVNKKTTILKLMQEHPQLAFILITKYGLHCLGCPASSFETLEGGARAHGLNEKEIEAMVDDMNRSLAKD